ncbi:MAG: class I SAM-dependent methyltransferase [Dehalococcoidia bacterium]
MAQPKIDKEKAEAFVGRLIDIYAGGSVALMIDVGYRTGLLEAAAKGPGTSQELAERAGLSERHVREWLGAMVTGGVFTYDAASKMYTLPPEHAVALTGRGTSNLAPFSQFVGLLGRHVQAVTETFKNGGGVPYSVFRPEFTTVMDAGSRLRFDEILVDGYLAASPEIKEKLQRGVSVADIGCGTGHSANVMAKAFPRSTFVGYDIAEDALAAARVEAEQMGITNASFENRDVAGMPTEQRFDLITVFDAIHDQAEPDAVLRGVCNALQDDGTFLMIDIHASSNLEENMDIRLAPFMYTVSAMHCMQVSLAENGAGLGAMWGEQLARQMLNDAGFGRVDVSRVDGDPLNNVYVCRK